MKRFSTTHALIESGVIPTAAVILGFYENNADPLYLHAEFPWLWLMPLLIALRYGFVFAAMTCGIYIAAMGYTVYFGFFDWSAYYLWLLGGLIMTAIGVEYHHYWRKRLFHQNERGQYLNKRLENLSRAYSVMRISHDTLEEALIVKPITLRRALTTLREFISENHGMITEASAIKLMSILVYVSNINKANLYLFENKKLIETPIGSVGLKKNIAIDDPLVKKCLAEKETVYTAVNTLETDKISDYVAVIPLKTASNHIIGLLTIDELPYSSMTDETLKILAVLLAYLADSLWAEFEGKDILALYPSCPPYFASELNTCLHLYKIAKLESTLFYYRLNNTELGQNISKIIQHQARGLDVVWENISDKIYLTILMPLTNTNQIDAYLERVNHKLKSDAKIQLDDESNIRYHFHDISTHASLEKLMNGLKQHVLS